LERDCACDEAKDSCLRGEGEEKEEDADIGVAVVAEGVRGVLLKSGLAAAAAAAAADIEAAATSERLCVSMLYK
jgi:hypothetical protein